MDASTNSGHDILRKACELIGLAQTPYMPDRPGCVIVSQREAEEVRRDSSDIRYVPRLPIGPQKIQFWLTAVDAR